MSSLVNQQYKKVHTYSTWEFFRW